MDIRQMWRRFSSSFDTREKSIADYEAALRSTDSHVEKVDCIEHITQAMLSSPTTLDYYISHSLSLLYLNALAKDSELLMTLCRSFDLLLVCYQEQPSFVASSVPLLARLVSSSEMMNFRRLNHDELEVWLSFCHKLIRANNGEMRSLFRDDLIDRLLDLLEHFDMTVRTQCRHLLLMIWPRAPHSQTPLLLSRLMKPVWSLVASLEIVQAERLLDDLFHELYLYFLFLKDLELMALTSSDLVSHLLTQQPLFNNSNSNSSSSNSTCLEKKVTLKEKIHELCLALCLSVSTYSDLAESIYQDILGYARERLAHSEMPDIHPTLCILYFLALWPETSESSIQYLLFLNKMVIKWSSTLVPAQHRESATAASTLRSSLSVPRLIEAIISHETKRSISIEKIFSFSLDSDNKLSDLL